MPVSALQGQIGRFQATAGGKSLLLKAITILYDGTTQTLVTLLLACCLDSAMAQSDLPACLGTDVTRWTACFGTDSTAGYTYIGEFKDDKRSGQGTYTFVNGEKYVGEFKDGKRNGLSTYAYALAPSEQRVRGPRVKNDLISCSWLHLLKVWSALKSRGDSAANLLARLAADSFALDRLWYRLRQVSEQYGCPFRTG